MDVLLREVINPIYSLFALLEGGSIFVMKITHNESVELTVLSYSSQERRIRLHGDESFFTYGE